MKCLRLTRQTQLRRPLLVTQDPQLLDELIGLAASCGLDFDVVPDLARGRSLCHQVPLVLVGEREAERAERVCPMVSARTDELEWAENSFRAGCQFGFGDGRWPVDAAPLILVVVREPGQDQEPPWETAEAVGAAMVAVLPEGAPGLMAQVLALLHLWAHQENRGWRRLLRAIGLGRSRRC
jgi:hypothetical protein